MGAVELARRLVVAAPVAWAAGLLLPADTLAATHPPGWVAGYRSAMATPITARTALRALKEEGLKVREVSSWASHNRNHMGHWGPVHGVMLHHTVTKGVKGSVELCRDGYQGLPGPLCHGVIDKSGVVHMVGWGRTNHAGLGDRRVLDKVIREEPTPAPTASDRDGNRYFYGFECINLGDGKDPWPARQVNAMVRASVAICRLHGWNARSVIGHLEWQPGKPDPRGVSMDNIRKKIQARL